MGRSPPPGQYGEDDIKRMDGLNNGSATCNGNEHAETKIIRSSRSRSRGHATISDTTVKKCDDTAANGHGDPSAKAVVWSVDAAEEERRRRRAARFGCVAEAPLLGSSEESPCKILRTINSAGIANDVVALNASAAIHSKQVSHAVHAFKPSIERDASPPALASASTMPNSQRSEPVEPVQSSAVRTASLVCVEASKASCLGEQASSGLERRTRSRTPRGKSSGVVGSSKIGMPESEHNACNVETPSITSVVLAAEESTIIADPGGIFRKSMENCVESGAQDKCQGSFTLDSPVPSDGKCAVNEIARLVETALPSGTAPRVVPPRVSIDEQGRIGVDSVLTSNSGVVPPKIRPGSRPNLFASGPKPPPMPRVQLPEVARIVITVPVVLRMRNRDTLGDIRKHLRSEGVESERDASRPFRCRGNPDTLDDRLLVSDLPDVRLFLAPDPDVAPWQLVLAHARRMFMNGAYNSHGAIGLTGPLQLRAMQQMQMQMQTNPLYKTRLCGFWMQSGGHCAKGARCIYAHGPAELRPRVPMSLIQANSFGALRPFLQGPLKAGLPGAVRPWASFQGLPLGPAGQRLPAGFIVGGSAAVAPALATAPTEEFVFTVNEEERKRREERARRFAPRRASFEADAAPAATPEPLSAVDSPRSGSAATDTKSNHQDVFACGDGDRVGSGEQDAEFMEENIAEYLLDMQQQYMLGGMSLEDGAVDEAAGTVTDEVEQDEVATEIKARPCRQASLEAF